MQVSAGAPENAPISSALEPVPGWPAQVRDVEYPSSADHNSQRTLFYAPPGDAPVPLLVALHTWSADYRQKERAYADWCLEHGWALLHPNFRGANDKPEACGSELVVRDILSAVHFARQNAKIDAERIYLIGASGGGYAAMLMAGRAPQLWAGVSAWCGIFDLAAWHAESRKRGQRYADMLEACCGGTPDAASDEYRRRSASTWLARAAGLPLDINTGIYDGHQGSVPVSHSLQAFNVLAEARDQLSPEEIRFITERAEIPTNLAPPEADPAYGAGKVLLRRVSGAARITVFQGGHEIIAAAGLGWLSRQRKGQPAVWTSGQAVPVGAAKTEIGG